MASLSAPLQKSADDFWLTIGSPFLTQTGGRPIPTDAQLLLEYLTNDLVYTCVNWNAGAVARVPMRLYVRTRPGDAPVASFPTRMLGDSEVRRLKHNPNLARRLSGVSTIHELTDHPLLDLLEQDNDGLNGFQLRYVTAIYMEVFGGAYWLLENGAFDPVEKIKVLPTQRVIPLRNGDLAVVAYRYLPALTGPSVDLPRQDVLDFRFPAVEDPYGGRHAPLRSAFMQAELAAKYALYENSLMDNRARIDGTFIPKEQIGRKEAERAEMLWNQKFARQGNGRVLVAEQSGTFIPTRYPPADLGPLEISRETLRRLAGAFGVPEALLSKDATFANMQASMTLYARQTILPRVLILEQKLNEMLTPRYGPRLFLAADNPVPEDESFNLQKAQLAINAGVLTKNEIRVIAGFAPASLEEQNLNSPNSQIAADAITQPPAAEPQAAPVAEPPGTAAAAPQTESRAAAAKSRRPRISALLAINRAVGNGLLDRDVAMAIVARQWDLSAADAARYVGPPGMPPIPAGAPVSVAPLPVMPPSVTPTACGPTAQDASAAVMKSPLQPDSSTPENVPATAEFPKTPSPENYPNDSQSL